MKDEIHMIPIAQIRILNPRYRDRKKFEKIVQSIKNLGLKKPIQVSIRAASEAEGPGFDLVCGQGRIEAFMVLGYKEIPAIVVEVSKEDRLLRSLVENMARRFSAPLDLINEIQRLKGQGYSNVQIGKKLDIADTTVGGLIALSTSGEERILEAALRGSIPLGVAMDIAKANTMEMQRELLKAYESNQLNQASIRTVKRLIEQRRLLGKKRKSERGSGRWRSRASAQNLVEAYKRESQRQKALVRKAKFCEQKITFIIGAFTKLIADDNFVNLLRAESLSNMPKYLWAKIGNKKKEAA